LTPLVQEFLARVGNETGPSPLRVCFTPDEATYEERLVEGIFKSIKDALKYTDSVAAEFIQADTYIDLREHLECCRLIQSALFSVHGILNSRSELSET
jgi:hypothetical protein